MVHTFCRHTLGTLAQKALNTLAAKTAARGRMPVVPGSSKVLVGPDSLWVFGRGHREAQPPVKSLYAAGPGLCLSYHPLYLDC